MRVIYALTAECVDENGWVDLERWFNEPLRNIPRSIREEDEGITHCNSIVAETGDIYTDPRRGGIAGVKILAAIYGVSEQQFRRNILPKLSWMRWLGKKPITNVCSAMNGANIHKAIVQNIRLKNLDISYSIKV
jgi:hypothetical protein